jgi:molybdate transport system ATP-binding protein
VTRVLSHDREAEVMVRTGGVDWIVSVVEPAVAALNLGPGVEVNLVIKARSCHIVDGSGPAGGESGTDRRGSQ